MNLEIYETLRTDQKVHNPIFDTVPEQADLNKGVGSRLIRAFWIDRKVMLIEYRAWLRDGFDLLEPKDGQIVNLGDNDLKYIVERCVEEVWPAWIAEAGVSCVHPLYLEACPAGAYVMQGHDFPSGRTWLIRIDGDRQHTVGAIAFS